MSSGSVTLWFRDLEQGDEDAATRLWEHYGPRIVRLARQRMAGVDSAPADEEDVVQSAFFDLCQGAQAGKFAYVADREALWRLLMLIVARKAANRYRHDRRQKRRPTAQELPGELSATVAVSSSAGGELQSPLPSPDFAAEMAETFQRLLDELGDPVLQQIALLKMEGYEHTEIAARLGCVPRTIVRKVQLIRRLWQSTTAS
ncbi:MAG: hypothetical protein K1X74_22230 [Pirellulales bacterium]|nr:hypothetical protein [Pirellulales bacterium]